MSFSGEQPECKGVEMSKNGGPPARTEWDLHRALKASGTQAPGVEESGVGGGVKARLGGKMAVELSDTLVPRRAKKSASYPLTFLSQKTSRWGAGAVFWRRRTRDPNLEA
jgi:hypothetical protein